MTRRKSAVGALSGIVANIAAADAGSVAPEQRLPIESIRVNAQVQPRRDFADDAHRALTQSVTERGILQPLLVRPLTAGGYELVAGERRLRAAVASGLTDVPVVIREMSDDAAREAALIENLMREDLNVVDELDATLVLIAGRLNLTPDAVPGRLQALRRPTEDDAADLAVLETLFTQLGSGTWTSFAKNKLRILGWPQDVLAAMRSGGLPYYLAGQIATAEPALRQELLQMHQDGRSRAELLAHLRAGRAGPTPPARMKRLGQTLASDRWYARLAADEQRAVQDWLASAPGVIRSLLAPEVSDT